LSFFSVLSDGVWDFFPDTPLAYIGYMVFIFSLCMLIILYIARKFKTSQKKNIPTNEKKEYTLDELLKIAQNPQTSLSELLSVLLVYNEKFTVKDDVEKSLLFFETVLNHKNRDKKLFDFFHGTVLPKNIMFKDELDALEKKALNKK